MYYRGVSNKEYALIPSIGRIANGACKNAVLCKEYKAFCSFQREYTLIASGLSPMDVAINAQHHGIPTRLLDWTVNPLVALFFAVKANNEKDGCIYIFDPISIPHSNNVNYNMFLFSLDKQLTKQFYKNKHPSLELGEHIKYFEWFQKNISYECVAVTPCAANRRVSLQSGVFTVQTDPFKDIISKFILYKIIVPASIKESILHHLSTINIHEYSLFGDADNLAKWISRSHFPGMLNGF